MASALQYGPCVWTRRCKHGGVTIAFLLVILTVYGLVQLLILWLLRRALRPGSRWRLAPVAFLILVNSTLVLSRLVTGWPGAARVVAFVGHWWVAASLWFVSIAAAVGLWNCAALVASRAGWKGRRLLISPRGLFGVSGVVMLGLTVWGVHEAGAIRLETVVIETPRLPAGSAPVRVVQLSDLQLSGHTHGRQVFPARWGVRLFYRHIKGRYELPEGATLYVSRGAGTFGPPMRVLSPPGVTLFILRPAP